MASTGSVQSAKRHAEEEENSEEESNKKFSFGLGKKPETSAVVNKKPLAPISMKLSTAQKTVQPQPTKVKIGAPASAFNPDESDSDDEEEMPPEAKMRMKNIGRNTPTSAGPNSFGKTRMGFCDTKKIYEKQIKEIQKKIGQQPE